MKVDFCKVLACFFVLFMICMKLPMSSADVVKFGSGSNTFTLRFEAVEDPNNDPSSSGFGAVNYSYGMSRYEVTEGMIDVYNSDSANALFPIVYDITGRGANKPATSITWNEAARFVNWLNIVKGYAPAYKFEGVNGTNISSWSEDDDLDYSEPNTYRSKRAVYVLPSIDEWFKAAYFDPSMNAGAGGYWNYSVQTNDPPNSVLGGTGAGDVVYGHGVNGSPADVTNAGGLSAYDVMAMNGNAWEWTESPWNGDYGSGANDRAFVGGSWASMFATDISSDHVLYYRPGRTLPQAGFRVVSLLDFTSGGDGGGNMPLDTVPEPGICLLCGTLSLAAACRKLRCGRRTRQQQ